MANKAQRRIRMSLRKANGELAIEIPIGGYHNSSKGAWGIRRIAKGVQPRISKKAKVAGKAAKSDFHKEAIE